MDTERLQRRVSGRDQAKAILSLLELTHPDMIDAFFDELRSHLLPEQAAAEQRQKERQFAEYANYRLTFGEHDGSKLENIPRWYLEWLADQSTEMLEMVTGYLESTEESKSDD